MPFTCCVPICRTNLKSGPKVTVFKFPTDEVLKLKWIAAIRRKDFIPSKNSRVCKMHFLESDIITEAHGYDEKTGKRLVAPLRVCRLKNDAVPKVFPGYPDYLTNISPRSKKLEYNAKKEGEEDDDDSHALEPTVIIKEEPTNSDPEPSTSAHSVTKEEFILSNEENTCASSAAVSPPTESTPPMIPNVICLGFSQDPDGNQQIHFKRRISSSSVSPSGTKRLKTSSRSDVLSDAVQNPLYNLDEYFNVTLSKDLEKAKDEFDVFGEYIAAKLRSLDRRSCAYAQKAIGDILFDAETKKYAMDELDQC